MFRLPTQQNTRRAQAQAGTLSPMKIPVKGMNARDAFSVMGPEFAISLNNVLSESYGLRTRKGYTEWATNIPGAGPVSTMMSYYPSSATPAPPSVLAFFAGSVSRMLMVPRASAVAPAGKMFAARGGFIYDVSAGGPGPWVAQPGVTGATDFWTWVNFQNAAGSFLVACNDAGGYVTYNGTTWTTVVAGTGAGQINNVDPATFCFVVEFKKRLWFIERNSTRAWYLPVGQLTGNATVFNFGEQFRRGGRLAALANWTIDAGDGIDDKLVAISTQGDVVIFEGTDPDTIASFQMRGVWGVGPLPVGRRAVVSNGGDILVLSQFGVTPISVLVGGMDSLEQKRSTYMIAPLVARLMRDFSNYQGWGIQIVPKEELFLISIPQGVVNGGPAQFLALKLSTGGWSVLSDLPYTSLVNIDNAAFAGTRDGRVVRAFDGPLDNARPAISSPGVPIQCQVTPSYQPMGVAGQQKIFKMVRPTFIATLAPTLKLQILTDYGVPKNALIPTLPQIDQSLWDQAKWDEGRWSGIQNPIKEWLGCQGVGFVGTVQLDYACGGDTLLASIDFWTLQGGAM